MKNSKRVLFNEQGILAYFRKNGKIAITINGEAFTTRKGKDEFVKVDRFPQGLRCKLENGKYVAIPFVTKRGFCLLNGNDEFVQIFPFSSIQFSEGGESIRELKLINFELQFAS